MKCEKCNDREANFHFSSIINDEKTEMHLCDECAREAQFEFFRPIEAQFELFRPMAAAFAAPFGSFSPAPRSTIGRREVSIPLDAGDDIRHRRELSALRHQLEEAVKGENFERAIELRNAIKQLEQ